MKILFVTSNIPFPPTDGWKIRVYAFLRLLSRRHQVSVASFIRTTESNRTVESLRAQGIDVRVIPRRPRYDPIKLLKGLIGPMPFPIINYRDERMRALLTEMLSGESFDVVQAESLHMAQYCLGLSLPTILDLHNIESLLMQRYAQQASHPLKRFYAARTWRKLAAYERTVCPRFTHCLTCSEEERRLLRAWFGVESVHVVPNGVDVVAYRSYELAGSTGRAPSSGSRLVFIGRMDYHANIDGVRWFCRDVFPRIRAQRPDVVFQVVGGHPARAITRMAQPGVIEVTGFVEDVRPYLAGASVVVVPLRIGGGTRLKILEALAMGRAIVSTRLGAEGIAAVPGRDLVVADRSDEFADQVLALLKDEELRLRLGASAQRLAASCYDWRGIVHFLEGVYGRCRSAPLSSKGIDSTDTSVSRSDQRNAQWRAPYYGSTGRSSGPHGL